MIKNSLYFLIFLEGFLVMGVELTSSLILKPYFGGSLEVWTFIIGITMSSLALGYFFGSFLAKKLEVKTVCYYLFFGISLLIFLMPFISKTYFRSFIEEDVTGILVRTVPMFLFPPLFLLGSLSSILVKGLNEVMRLKKQAVANVFAISTLSGVFALLLITFFLVGKIDTLVIVYLLSLLAFLAVVIIHFSLKKNKTVIPLSIFYACLSVYYFTNGKEKITDIFPIGVKEMYHKDGILGQIIVLKDFNSKTKILMVNNSVQTTTDFENNGNFIHVRDINNFLNQKKKKDHVLIAGLGGGSLVVELSKSFKQIDVLEIDKNMMDVCRKEFYLPQNKNIQYIIDDARHYFNTSKKKYDAIVLDLSIGETIPANVYTKEAFEKMAKMLTKNGVIIINFFSKDSSEGLMSVASIHKTLKASALDTRILKRVEDSINQSAYIFVASNDALNFHDSLFYKALNISGELLIDDKTRLDVLHKNIILEQRKNYIFNYQKYFEEMAQ